jgi:hypothetical protein
MKIVIVFESMFGNTETFAREIAEGFAPGNQVSLVDVRHVRAQDVSACDLLVVGAPTHAFSLSRPGTRREAVAKGADASHEGPGAREWLSALDAGTPAHGTRPLAAVFDTRVTKVRHLPGSAARGAARLLRARGFEVLPASSFYVEDVKGPPAARECVRARQWAADLGRQLPARGRQSAS